MRIERLKDLQGRLRRILSTARFAFGITALVAFFCAIMIDHVHQNIEQLRVDQLVFESQNLRGSFIALVDVQRLLLAFRDAILAGDIVAARLNHLSAANDMLFVRVESFYTTLEGDLAFPSAAGVVGALRDLVETVDDAASAGFPEPDVTWETLLVLAQESRVTMIDHIDLMQRFQSDLLQAQLSELEKTRSIIIGSSCGLVLFAGSALLLLRWEIKENSARRKAEGKLRHFAYHDALTGLRNRASFKEALDRWIEIKASVTMMIVDIDGFKLINDTYGHAAGDAILVHLAQVLQQFASKYDGIAARLGGDEFAFILAGSKQEKTKEIYSQLITAASEQVAVEGARIQANISIGIAQSGALGASVPIDSKNLSRAADFALYHAKTEGRGRAVVYGAELQEAFARRQKKIEDLPLAVKNGEMEVFLQPQVNLHSLQIAGFEALVRWRQGDVLLMPVDFIQIAEESGNVVEIDDHVLAQACQKVSDFNNEHGTNLFVSVNFSALHFRSLKSLAVIQNVLKETGLPPHLLTIEVTETVDLDNWKEAGSIIQSIKELGVHIAMDDFGSGFSSLSYLQDTTVDEVKIDQSLVRAITTSEKSYQLLHSVIKMIHFLGLRVTVEGIETQAELEAVRDMGAETGQGFLWSKPVPAKAALQLVHVNKAHRMYTKG